MARKSTAQKAKDLGIDLNKTSIGNIVDRLHKSEKNLDKCRDSKTGECNVAGARDTTKKVVSTGIKAAKKAKGAVKNAAKGAVDAVCDNR